MKMLALARTAQCLSLATSQTDFRTQALLQEAGGTASTLELVKFVLGLDRNRGCLFTVTPASVADLTESKVQVRAGDTNPVTNSLRIELLGTLKSRKR